MADKLSESLWTGFTRKAKLDLDDGALVKALARFDKSDAAKPEPRLDALQDVVEQVKKLVVALTKKKKELGDKLFNEAKDKLYLVLDLAETLHKDTEAAAASVDEEADSPVLLTAKMIPLVRELRKGDVTMNALICTAGRGTAVLIMRKAIATTRRKMLAEALDAKGGAKYIVGEVLLENQALTFVVQSSAAGLAKRLRQALLDQLQLRLKVRVRGDDGAEDLDGQDEDEGSDGDTGQSAAGPGGGTIPEAPPLPGTQPGAQAQVAQPGKGVAEAGTSFKARLTALLPAIKEAAASGKPAAQDIKLKASEAGMLAGKKDFERANALLDEVERLLAGPAGTAPGGDPMAEFKSRLTRLIGSLKPALESGKPGGDQQRKNAAEAGALANKREFQEANALLDQIQAWLDSGAAKGGPVALQTSRLAWNDFRNSVQSQLKNLERELLAQVKAHNAEAGAGQEPGEEEQFDEAEVAVGVQRIYTVLERFDIRLIDKLDQALNASGAERAKFQSEAAGIVREYQSYVDGDPLIAGIDDNGFLATTIRSEARKTLGALAQQL